jgi:two-component system chemotaxis response regulator CheY
MTNTPTRILVADDTDQVRDMLVLILQARLNIPAEQIDAASDGFEASDFLAKNSYKLVFTDNDMPGKTGVELIREIRSNTAIHQPKIIMQSGDGDEVAQQAKAAGANAFISKPATVMQIVAVYSAVTNEGVYRPPGTSGMDDPSP